MTSITQFGRLNRVIYPIHFVRRHMLIPKIKIIGITILYRSNEAMVYAKINKFHLENIFHHNILNKHNWEDIKFQARYKNINGLENTFVYPFSINMF